jgi:hypothetical protein
MKPGSQLIRVCEGVENRLWFCIYRNDFVDELIFHKHLVYL